MKRLIIIVFLIFGANQAHSQSYDSLISKFFELSNKDDFSGAILILSRAIELDSTKFQAYALRGTTKNSLNDPSGGLNDLDRAISIVIPYIQSSIATEEEKVTFSGIFEGRGISKLGLEDDQGAIEDFTRSIELDPKNSRSYFARGLARLNIDEENLGCMDLRKAEELGNPFGLEAFEEYCN